MSVHGIFDRYQQPVVSLAVLADDDPAWRPDRFSYELGLPGEPANADGQAVGLQWAVGRAGSQRESREGSPPWRKQMKLAAAILRVLMGLLFLFGSITYWLKLIEPPPLTGAMKTFNDGLDASIYLMPTVKLVELFCGIAFVVGRFVPLATVVISPIIVNIVLVHAFLAPEGLPVAVFLVVANAFVAYQHRDAFKPLLKA